MNQVFEKYAKNIDIYDIVIGDDDLGSSITTYKFNRTIKGIVEIASTQQRLVAAQLGITNAYTIAIEKTEIINIDTQLLKTANEAYVRITSDFIEPPETSTFKDLKQAQGEQYEVVL